MSAETPDSATPELPAAADQLQNTQEPPPFRYYRPSTIASTPDEYYNPTTADIRAAQSTLQARTQTVSNTPHEVRRVREERERIKRERWPTTTIRIRFSDRSQLEKVFQSTDKIRSIYAFVRGCLREDVKPIKFILYQSPPKRDLKVSDPAVRDLTLSELQLSPSSVLLIRFDDDSLDNSDVPAPLTPSILEQAIDIPLPPNPEPEVVAQPDSSRPRAPVTTSKGGSVPKWLKLGKK